MQVDADDTNAVVSVRMQMQTPELLESFQSIHYPYPPSLHRRTVIPAPTLIHLYPKSAHYAKIAPLPSHGSNLAGSFLVPYCHSY